MITGVSTLVVILAFVCTPTTALAKEAGAKAKQQPPQGRQYQAWGARAGEPRSPWAREQGWGRRARGKLFFGLKNVLLGWTEPFTEAYEAASQTRRGKVLQGAIGFCEGIGNGVIDTIGGAQHVLTFPLTKIDIPLPENGVQLL